MRPRAADPLVGRGEVGGPVLVCRRGHRGRFLGLLLVAVLSAAAAAKNAPGQGSQSEGSKSRPSLPPRPTPPLADQEQFISYWTTEAGWDTEIQLRNNQASGALTVTPALRSADGVEVRLQPVVVEPHEVKIVDLAAATGGTPLLGAYGSAVLRYRAPDQASLFAMAMIRAVGHPFAFHIDPSEQLPSYATGAREGIWWLPKETTNGYLIVTNVSGKPVDAILSIYDAGGKGTRQQVNLAAASTNRYSIRQLVTVAGLGGAYGGISVSAAQHADSIGTLGLLFDQATGFSALLKMYDHHPDARIAERDYARTGVWTLRAPMLALENPDPALGFPLATALDPQLLIRNTTPKPVGVNLSFHYWQGDSATGQAAGPSLELGPYETRRVDVATLEAAKLIPADAHWASVTMTTSGPPDGIMAIAASYDSSLRHGAQTPFSDQLAFHWVGSLWQYDALHDSMITVGNGGTKPVQALFTLYYNQGMGKYQIERTLTPGDQMWVDVGDLVREHVPDANGSFLPSDVTYGSYDIRQLGGGVGTLFEGKVVYDKTYGEVTYGCGACCAYKGVRLFYDPLAIPFGFESNQGVEAMDTCSGLWDDISMDFDNAWSTENTAIATADSWGTHTGVSVGSTWTLTSPKDVQTAEKWNYCPLEPRGPIGGDDVASVRILLGGRNGTDITGTTRSAYIGRQIVLYGFYALPSGASLSSQSWSVAGTTVGGFASGSSGGPLPTNFGQQSTTFYWTVAGSSEGVSFTVSYIDSAGKSQKASAQAAFDLAGPTSVNVTTALGNWQISSGPDLQLGCQLSGCTNGIKLSGSATSPSGDPGTYEYAQAVSTFSVGLTSGSTTTTCNWVTGLDTGFPYTTGLEADDSPLAALEPGYSEETFSFAATMYLMWNPSTGSNDIPVPLGYVTWQAYGDATFSNDNWNIQSDSSRSTSPFQGVPSWPQWNSTFNANSQPTCQ